MHGPFGSIEDAQSAVDSWCKDYNAERPHQSLGMAFPAARFAPGTGDALGLRIPAELTQPSLPPPICAAGPAPDDQAPVLPAPVADGPGPVSRAVELDREVPPSGNLWLAGQQIWLGAAMTGRTVRLWAGRDQVHALLDGYRIKTVPSRLMPAPSPAWPHPEPGWPGRRRCPRHPAT